MKGLRLGIWDEKWRNSRDCSRDSKIGAITPPRAFGWRKQEHSCKQYRMANSAKAWNSTSYCYLWPLCYSRWWQLLPAQSSMASCSQKTLHVGSRQVLTAGPSQVFSASFSRAWTIGKSECFKFSNTLINSLITATKHKRTNLRQEGFWFTVQEVLFIMVGTRGERQSILQETDMYLKNYIWLWKVPYAVLPGNTMPRVTRTMENLVVWAEKKLIQ